MSILQYAIEMGESEALNDFEAVGPEPGPKSAEHLKANALQFLEEYAPGFGKRWTPAGQAELIEAFSAAYRTEFKELTEQTAGRVEQ